MCKISAQKSGRVNYLTNLKSVRNSPANQSSHRPPRAPEPHPAQRQEKVLPANNPFSRQVRIFLQECVRIFLQTILLVGK